MSSHISTRLIDSISVKGFQSLYDVEIPLTRFTAIVGPSSSGKSAVVRALKLLLQNQRGSSFISHGLSQCEVTAKLESWGQTVTIRRGKLNEYEIQHVDGTDRYTKLGGDVPEDVKNFLGLDPELSVASQFDPPYLLTSSGSEVARALGSLTNVEVVFQAAREASRQKLSHGTLARHLQGQLDQTNEQLELLGDLDALEKDVVAAEGALQLAKELDKEITELLAAAGKTAELMVEYRRLQSEVVEVPELGELFQIARSHRDAAAEGALQVAGLKSLLEQLQKIMIVEVPDVAELLEEARRFSLEKVEAEEVIGRFSLEKVALQEAEEVLRSSSEEVHAAEEAKIELLQQLGVCPTCGQGTKHLHA